MALAPAVGDDRRPRRRIGRMMSRSALVGREAERTRLEDALRNARGGRGSLVLLGGEAGVGKTRLADEVLQACGARALHARSIRGAGAPYGPVVATLREYLRADGDGLAGCGPLRAHLAMLLPEFGESPASADRGTLLEAVRCAFEQLAAGAHDAVVLDDLQWSDDATLELLPALAEALGSLSLLVVGVYRSDGLPRDHTLRRVRHELRRAGRLDEITLAALEPEQTAELLEQILRGRPAPSLVRTVQDRAHGIPFFVEELARALRVSSALATGRRGLELAGDGDVPVPDTVRDAVLVSAAELTPEARAAAEAAAVAGDAFELEVVGAIASAAGLAELLESGLIAETAPGRAAFRHALTREALYADVPWLQRRALHRALAEALEAAGAGNGEIATHWLGARDAVRARAALLRAADESRAVHAHRDATRAARQALELWPEGDDEELRVCTLESYAASAELSGDLAEAARAWREICTIRTGASTGTAAGPQLAQAQRRLAAVYELRGDRESAGAARRAAAAAYAAAGSHAEAAVERLAVANYLRASASYSAAIELAREAGGEAALAGRVDLRARALGIEGVVQAKGGDRAGGLEAVRAGLALALDHDLTPVAGRRRALPAPEPGPLRGRRLPPRAGGARQRAGSLPRGRRAGHRGRLRDLHGLRPARVRRLEGGAAARPRADRVEYRRLGRGGLDGRHLRLPGQAQLGATAARVRARDGHADRPLQHVRRHHRRAGLGGGGERRRRRGRRALRRAARALGAQ
jgi:hypothetical protein